MEDSDSSFCVLTMEISVMNTSTEIAIRNVLEEEDGPCCCCFGRNDGLVSSTTTTTGVVMRKESRF